MTELPKSVHDRLAAAQATGAAVHPDSDLLAAFAEGALLRDERERVLTHLAVCPDCRTVVALAQPEDVQQTVVAPNRKRAWFEWKVFRVGAAIAAVAVVAIAVLLHRPESRKSGFDDTSFAKPSPAGTQEEPQMAAPSPKKAEDTARLAKRAPADKAKDTTHSEALFDRLEAAGAAHQSKQVKQDAGERDEKNALKEQAALSAVPAASPPPAAEKSIAPSISQPAASAVGGVVNGPQPYLRQDARKVDTATRTNQVTVESAAEATPAQQQRIGSQVQAAPLAMRQNAQMPLNRDMGSQWRINDAGMLQRNIADQEWRTISPGGMSDFRTVASSGNHVWAGGSRGLFHSSDGGDHWSRVQIGSPGEGEIGEIVNIRVTNTNELSVYTASGDVWMTRNGGRTWSRQPK